MNPTEICLPTLMIFMSFGLPVLCGDVSNFAVNIAYGKPATQSSTYVGSADNTPGYQYAASLAVDGNKNTSFKADGCSHTEWTNNSAWWEVDLLGLYTVSIITIYQRTDDNKEWLSGFVTKGKLANDSFVIIDNPHSSMTGTITILIKTNMKFKGIRIELRKENPPCGICLCEVEVLAEINVAENKIASQSSDYKETSPEAITFAASFAVDGKTTTNFNEHSCSCTKPGERSAWWKVDLRALYLIIGIRIYQRSDAKTDRLDGFKLFGLHANGSYEPIGTPDTYHTGIIDISISPPRMIKEIMVQLNQSRSYEGPIITLCEVQVFAGSMCSNQPPFRWRRLENVFPSKDGNGSYNFSLQCIEGYSISRPISNLCAGINLWTRTFGRCSDVDECSIQPSACHNVGQCFNSNGNLGCKCNPGYKGAACENVKRCDTALLHRLNGFLTFIDGIGGNDTYNATVHLNCNEGYKLNNGGQSICAEDETWHGSVGDCVDIDECRAQVSAGCHNQGTCLNTQGSFTCTCNPGFTGSACESLVRCNNSLPQPVHGQLNYTGGIHGTGTYNTVVTVSCEEGYALSTATEVICSKSGKWEGQTGICSVIRCPPLQYSGKNGSLLHIQTGLDNLIDSYGAKFRMKCDMGYVSNTTSEIVCTTSAKWNTTIDNCQAITCPIPHMIPENSISHFIPGIAGNLTYNSSVNITCHEGYKLQGNEVVVNRCTTNGTWSEKSFGICFDVDECAHGDIVCNNSGHCTNTQGSYKCRCYEGFAGRNCEIDRQHALGLKDGDSGDCDCHEQVILPIAILLPLSVILIVTNSITCLRLRRCKETKKESIKIVAPDLNIQSKEHYEELHMNTKGISEYDTVK